MLKPEVVQTWPLFDSLFRRGGGAGRSCRPGENVASQFHSWVNWNFVTSPQSSDPLKAGIATAIFGSLWVTLLAFFVAIPLGVAAAIYLEEYKTAKAASTS